MASRSVLLPVFVGLAVVRAFIWGVLAVENEHVKNSMRFRNKSKYVPVLFENETTSERRRASTVTGYGVFIEILLMCGLIAVMHFLFSDVAP